MYKVQKSIKSLLALFTIIMFIMGWGGWGILKQIYPEMNLNWYPYLPATFFVMGFVLIVVLEKINKDNPRRLVNIYMLMKLLKIVIALTIVLVYYFVVKENMRLFLLVFGIYYAIYLLIEFYIFYITEKKIKQSK